MLDDDDEDVMQVIVVIVIIDDVDDDEIDITLENSLLMVHYDRHELIIEHDELDEKMIDEAWMNFDDETDINEFS